MARTVKVIAKEVCAPPDGTINLEFDVLPGSTIGDVKRLVSIEKPAWVMNKQLFARKGSLGTLADDAPAIGDGDLLCWVSCVCQRKPLTNLFVPTSRQPLSPDDQDDDRPLEDILD